MRESLCPTRTLPIRGIFILVSRAIHNFDYDVQKYRRLISYGYVFPQVHVYQLSNQTNCQLNSLSKQPYLKVGAKPVLPSDWGEFLRKKGLEEHYVHPISMIIA
jgi:hypothetical protein